MKFDSTRFYEAVERRREDERLSWRQLATRLSLSPSTFSRLAQGKRPDVDTFVKLLAWLQQPATDFVQELPSAQPPAASSADVLRDVRTSLRRDPALSSENAEALEDIVRVAYYRLRRS
jgi:transcriptional regulator with XRE-family HTH domain